MMLFFFLFHHVLLAQEDKDFAKIREYMQKQQDAWNMADIDSFMEYYWKSEDLQFFGANGLTKGWQQTKENYFRRYPDKTAMGQLNFGIVQLNKRSKKVITLLGTFHLRREIGDLSGHFLLIWQKIKGKWVIVADHTC